MHNEVVQALGLKTGKDITELLNESITIGYDKVFKYKENTYQIHRYYMCTRILNVTNAGKRGKEVQVLSFSYQDENSTNDIFDIPFENIHDIFTNNSIGDLCICSDTEKVRISLYSDKACNYINPDFSTYKKLTEKPKRWTKVHVIRALLNNQFTDLKCDGYYTDDYAWDYSNNYGRKPIENVKEFCTNVLGGSFYIYEDRETENKIHVNQYSFNTNSFILQI